MSLCSGKFLLLSCTVIADCVFSFTVLSSIVTVTYQPTLISLGTKELCVNRGCSGSEIGSTSSTADILDIDGTRGFSIVQLKGKQISLKFQPDALVVFKARDAIALKMTRASV